VIKFDFFSGDWDEQIEKEMKSWLKKFKCKYKKHKELDDEHIVYAEAPNLLWLAKFLRNYNADWEEIKSVKQASEYFDYLFSGEDWRKKIKNGKL